MIQKLYALLAVSLSFAEEPLLNTSTSNLRYHLQWDHIDKFKELESKQEEVDKKAEEYEVKWQKTYARQLYCLEWRNAMIFGIMATRSTRKWQVG